MHDLHFDLALLPGGWARDVRARVTPNGDFGVIQPEADPQGARRIAGAAVPGVPNLHSHAFQRAMAGLTERRGSAEHGFWGWREQMYAFLARLTPDDVQVIAAQLYAEMLRHGYTAVTEFHYLRNDLDGRPYAVAHEMALRLHEAAAHSGIGLTLLPTLYRVADFGATAPVQQQRRFDERSVGRLRMESVRTVRGGHRGARLPAAVRCARGCGRRPVERSAQVVGGMPVGAHHRATSEISANGEL